MAAPEVPNEELGPLSQTDKSSRDVLEVAQTEETLPNEPLAGVILEDSAMVKEVESSDGVHQEGMVSFGGAVFKERLVEIGASLL